MIAEFSDKLQPDAHDKFQEWRRKNPDGFLLAMKTKKKCFLHRASPGECSHLDDDTSTSADWSRVKKPKICSLDRAELQAWARRHEVSVEDCSNCI
jgi:hypothetical protein